MSEPAKRGLITGQNGSYLAELLQDKGYEVHRLNHRSRPFNTGRIDPTISTASRTRRRHACSSTFGQLGWTCSAANALQSWRAPRLAVPHLVPGLSASHA